MIHSKIKPPLIVLLLHTLYWIFLTGKVMLYPPYLLSVQTGSNLGTLSKNSSRANKKDLRSIRSLEAIFFFPARHYTMGHCTMAMNKLVRHWAFV